MNKLFILIFPMLLGPSFLSPVLGENEITFVKPPNDLNYVYGTTNHNITWIAESDINGTYIVYRNDSKIANGVWQSNKVVNVNIDWFDIGFYLMNITLYNEYDLISAIVEITITQTATDVPNDIQAVDIIFMEVPQDFTYEVNTFSNNIRWIAYTENPTFYSIHEVDTFQLGEWESMEPVETNVDGYGLGEHTITLILYNSDSGVMQDSITFEVVNRIIPVITPIETQLKSELIIDEFVILLIGSIIIIVIITILIVYRSRRKFEIQKQQ